MSRILAEIFAERLRMARERKHLSQAELAEKIRLEPSSLSHFEKARRFPSIAKLCAIADVLTVSVDFLLGRDRQSQAMGPRVQALLAKAEKLTDRDFDAVLMLADGLAKK
jgi:transcriptional regulator with XRE-family HTH domain